jgi:DNA modification methylase
MDSDHGLPSLPDQFVDLCLTDPPYNVSFDGSLQSDPTKCWHKTAPKEYKEKKQFYNDSIENYKDWCIKWFNEALRISTQLIFTCGHKNLKMWINIKEPEAIFIHYKRNCASQTSLARFNRYEPILLYGKYRHQFDFQSNVFDIPLNNGFLRDLKTIHPSPKEFRLYYEIIKRLNPTTVIDPFLGSGTTACVCKKLQIKWLGYEVEQKYKSDIEYRLNHINPEVSWLQKKLIF